MKLISFILISQLLKSFINSQKFIKKKQELKKYHLVEIQWMKYRYLFMTSWVIEVIDQIKKFSLQKNGLWEQNLFSFLEHKYCNLKKCRIFITIYPIDWKIKKRKICCWVVASSGKTIFNADGLEI